MKNRDYAVDFIRLVAILAVIVIHTSTYFIDRTPFFTSNFYILYAINQAFRFAVPAFFAISGYLLGSRYQDLKSTTSFYKRRFSKIIPPYFVWSLIYFLVIFPNPLKSLFSKIFVNDLITGDSSYQLYFIPTIILLYLLFPLIIKFKKILLTHWFIIFWGLVELVVLSYLYYGHHDIAVISPIRNAFYNSFVFLVGIYTAINVKDIATFFKKHINLFKFIALASGVLIYIESLLLFKKTGIDDYLRNQWRPGVFIYGSAISALLYRYYQKSWNKTTSYLASFSFGVFFVHAAILHNIMIFVYNNKLLNLASFAISLSVTIILSFIFSIVFSRVKVLNILLGLRA